MKIAKSIKNCSFNCKMENTKKYILFLLKKKEKRHECIIRCTS